MDIEELGLADGEYTDGLMKYVVERYDIEPGDHDGPIRCVRVDTFDGDELIIWAH